MYNMTCIFSLCGRRGILALHAAFKDIKLKGKGYEKDNLDLVMKKLDHWAHRLFPKLPFDDCIERVEKLGSKKPVQVHKFSLIILFIATLHSGIKIYSNYCLLTDIPEKNPNGFDRLGCYK